MTWFSSQGMQTPSRTVTVATPSYGATYTIASPVTLTTPGGSAVVGVTVKNTGSMPWLRSQQINLAYHISNLAGVITWDGMRSPLSADVQPGGSIAVAAIVKAPATAGRYTITFDLVQEGVTWFSGQGVTGGSATLNVQ